MSFLKSVFNFIQKPVTLRAVCNVWKPIGSLHSIPPSGKKTFATQIFNKINNNRFCYSSNNLLTTRAYATDGDRDLVRFLEEEISYEQENVMEVPKFKDFNLKMRGTAVTLTRNFNNELVKVAFDVNDNINVDERLDSEDDHHTEEINIPDIISYPQFSVEISKSSGNTLHFSCSCNTGSPDDDIEQEEDEQFELFRFDNVRIEGEEFGDGIYDAETENMDGELYSLLMTTLLERGITGTFINDLIDLSTALEHRQYVQFLKSLQRFSSEK